LGDETNGGGLSLNFNSLFRIETDKRIDGDSYQVLKNYSFQFSIDLFIQICP